MDSLVPQYKEMAATGLHFAGLAILQHVKIVDKMVRKHSAQSILDYGCGRGDAYRAPHRLHAQLGLKWFNVTMYDPAFTANAAQPRGKFDGVLCSDVLEHIPEEDVDEFIENLFGYAKKFVWASVCCRPAAKTFPDGVTNLHVTLHPLDWWADRFEVAQAKYGIDFHLTETP